LPNIRALCYKHTTQKRRTKKEREECEDEWMKKETSTQPNRQTEKKKKAY
jgi:hypothetical protein